jgi:hypothetical protein
VDEVAPGLHRWTAWHEDWKEDVAGVAVDTAAGRVAIDPPGPPPDGVAPKHVLISVFFHARSAADAGADHVWAPARAVKRLGNRGVAVTDTFQPGDDLPGGIVAFATARDTEIVFWLPEQRAVVVGDVLLGAGAKPQATDDALRFARCSSCRSSGCSSRMERRCSGVRSRPSNRSWTRLAPCSNASS